MVACPLAASSAAVGSSARMAEGSATMARAIATRCCSPPLSWRGKDASLDVKPTLASITADALVLDEVVPFLTGQALQPGESDSFFQPTVSDETASLYEHCARALDASLAVGNHGLPLIGGGDWNDGMNRVGEGGRGESVWLGWLLHAASRRLRNHRRCAR